MTAIHAPNRHLTDAVRDDPAPDLHMVGRAVRLTCGLGIAFAVLFPISLLSLTGLPKLGASDADLATFYTSGSAQLVYFGGLYLLPFAAVAFIWFIAALREWLTVSGKPIDRLLSNVQMLSGVSFITLSFAAAGAASIVAIGNNLSDSPIDPAVAYQFPLYGRTLLMVFGLRMAAIFVTSTAAIGRGANLMPRWFTYGSLAVAAALFLVSTLNIWLSLVFPLWVFVLSLVIWQGSRHRFEASPRVALPAS
jgi:hypothetical protein